MRTLLQEAQQKIVNLEQKVDKLVATYNKMVVGDHHKDCDCRWTISRKWEYGEPAGWCVLHSGYIYCEIDERFDTFYEALQSLYEHLVLAIEQAKDCELDKISEM